MKNEEEYMQVRDWKHKNVQNSDVQSIRLSEKFLSFHIIVEQVLFHIILSN